MTTSHQAESIDLGAANQAALMAHIVNEKLTPESLVDSSVAAGNKFKTSEPA